jgi:hypothetical protein
MSKNNRKIVKERNRVKEVSLRSRRRQSLRNLKMKRRNVSSLRKKLRFSAKSRLNSTARNKRKWNSSAKPRSKGALRLKCERKRAKPNKKNSSAKRKLSWRHNSVRLRGKSARWIERMRSEGDA